MEYSLENEEAINFFVGERSLISSRIKSIFIFELLHTLIVELDVELLYSKKEKNVRIRFVDVIEYSFYHNKSYAFYNVEYLKFFQDGNAFYISLDPDETVASRSANDNDFILSNELKITITETKG